MNMHIKHTHQFQNFFIFRGPSSSLTFSFYYDFPIFYYYDLLSSDNYSHFPKDFSLFLSLFLTSSFISFFFAFNYFSVM